MILKGDLAKKTSEADELIALKKTLEKKLSQRKQGISDLTQLFDENKKENEDYKTQAEETIDKQGKQISDLEIKLQRANKQLQQQKERADNSEQKGMDSTQQFNEEKKRLKDLLLEAQSENLELQTLNEDLNNTISKMETDQEVKFELFKSD